MIQKTNLSVCASTFECSNERAISMPYFRPFCFLYVICTSIACLLSIFW